MCFSLWRSNGKVNLLEDVSARKGGLWREEEETRKRLCAASVSCTHFSCSSKVTCKHLNTRFKRFQPRFHSFADADTEPAHSPRCKNQTFSVLFVGRTKRYKAIFPRGWSHDSDIYLADRLQKAGTYTKLHTRVTFVYSSSDAAMTVTRYVLPPIWAESPAGLRAARGSACVFM